MLASTVLSVTVWLATLGLAPTDPRLPEATAAAAPTAAIEAAGDRLMQASFETAAPATPDPASQPDSHQAEPEEASGPVTGGTPTQPAVFTVVPKASCGRAEPERCPTIVYFSVEYASAAVKAVRVRGHWLPAAGTDEPAEQNLGVFGFSTTYSPPPHRFVTEIKPPPEGSSGALVLRFQPVSFDEPLTDSERIRVRLGRVRTSESSSPEPVHTTPSQPEAVPPTGQ